MRPSLELDIVQLIAEMGVKIKEMDEGEGFGEKALVERDGKRTTSVVTNADCEFIVITKEDYLNIIRKYDKRRQIKEEFMKQHIPNLSTINSPAIWDDIYYLIKDINYPRGSVIVNENEQGDKIFFIVEGCCEIEKNIVIKENDLRHEYEPIKMKKVIATFDAGSCFGDEIIFENKNTYDYTIKVRFLTKRLNKLG